MMSLKSLLWNASGDHQKVALAIIFTAILSAEPFFAVYDSSWHAYAEEFIVRVNQQVFVPGDTLVLYGKGAPDDVLVARIFDATGRAIRIDSIPADDDGFFEKRILEWPSPTSNLPFGTYTIEINSSLGAPSTQTIEVTFAAGSSEEADELAFPIQHILVVKLDSPTDVTIGKSFRIFVQVTIDGALVDEDPTTLLARSHIHSGNITINLSDKFRKLHEGIYYADVTLEQGGSYIIHSIAFYRGFLSHDSKVVTASAATLGTVQESVDVLNSRLESLNDEVTQMRSSLNATVSDAQTSIREDVEQVQEASGQLNSIILPVLALISVILALQISLFARIRASYR